MGRRKTLGLVPRPVLKWAGGKTQLLPELVPRVEKAAPFGRYHEPFFGSGALFFELYRTGRLSETPAALSDVNDRLMDVYRGLRDDVESVIALLEEHRARHKREHYYQVRAEQPEALAARAARLIYLNRTCFNGLFRENSRGIFNVPMGRYTNPTICDAENLRAVSEALRGTQLETRPFEAVVDEAEPGDLVYFDPPYDPVSKTASFTQYDQNGFGEAEQRRLAEVFRALDRKGVRVMLSNSHTPLVRSLYEGYRTDVVLATRRVNRRADLRGPVEEVLVTNFLQDGRRAVGSKSIGRSSTDAAAR